jgi:hypothetical protein
MVDIKSIKVICACGNKTTEVLTGIGHGAYCSACDATWLIKYEDGIKHLIEMDTDYFKDAKTIVTVK